eukprot:533120_1
MDQLKLAKTRLSSVFKPDSKRKCPKCDSVYTELELQQKGDRSCGNCDYIIPLPTPPAPSPSFLGQLGHIGRSLSHLIQSETDHDENDNENNISFQFPTTDESKLQKQQSTTDDWDDVINIKWDKNIKNISSLNNNQFLYVINVIINEMNENIKNISSKTHNELMLNKLAILSYLQNIKMNGKSFIETPKPEFIDKIMDFIIISESNKNSLHRIFISLNRIRQKYANQLYENITKFDSNRIKASDKLQMTFGSADIVRKVREFEPILSKNVSSIINTIDQYHHTSYLQTKLPEIANKLKTCNAEILHVLNKELQIDLENQLCSWKYSTQSLRECNRKNLMYIIDCILLNKDFSNYLQITVHFKKRYISKIIDHFANTHIDGSKFLSYNVKTFVQDLQNFIIDNSYGLKTKLRQLYHVIKNIDIVKVTTFELTQNPLFYEGVNILYECKLPHMVCIIIHIVSN